MSVVTSTRTDQACIGDELKAKGYAPRPTPSYYRAE